MIASLLNILAVLAALGAVLGIVLGLLQDFHPAMDSFSHFRLHFVAVLVAAAVILIFVRSGAGRWGALFVAALGIGFLTFHVRGGPPREAQGADFRLVQFNLNYGNRIIDGVATALTASGADIVALQEVTPAHEIALRAMTAYPHQTHCFFRERIGGVSILSKHPLSQIDCAKGQGLVTALVDVPGGAVTVASIHTYWPWPFSQHAQIDAWLPRLSAKTGPMIVAGDFNAAPWSHAVKKVAKASRTKVVPGLRMTIGLKLLPLVPRIPIPIDHVLLTDDFCGLVARIGPRIGSDHLPLIVEIGREDLSATTNCDRYRPLY